MSGKLPFVNECKKKDKKDFGYTKKRKRKTRDKLSSSAGCMFEEKK